MADNYDMIGIDVVGIEELQSKLMRFPQEAKDEAVDNASTYLLNVVKLYPPYAYVPFKSAYGGWFSEKQRRYVMAKIRSGEIKPGQAQRTQNFAKGWRKIGQGENSLLVNEVPYGKYLMGDQTQARMPAKIGWKTIGQTIKDRMDEVMRRAHAGVKNALRKLGL